MDDVVAPGDLAQGSRLLTVLKGLIGRQAMVDD